ncbi:MAG: helix-turn-helix transcriptional regulator [Clostridia bacterium]|nr:helix-turn-helix transcriptional regulator [Clostridia bacterium]
MKGRLFGLELKNIIAKNIAELRKANGLTQLALAEKLNYSDKAVSKWESGASIPDVVVLKEIADMFGVTVDSLLSEKCSNKSVEPKRKRVHTIITLLSVMLVWLIGTLAFAFMGIAGIEKNLWLSFVWCVPVSFIVLLVFNSIWGRRRLNYLVISCLMWSLLAAVYLSALQYNPWLLFVIGVPGQIIICLWSGFKKNS